MVESFVEKKKDTLVILGASDKPERYSYKVMKLALNQEHEVFLVHPSLKTIAGNTVFANLDSLKKHLNGKTVGTLTLYLSEKNTLPLVYDIAALGPQRVIVNPGADSPATIQALKKAGVNVQQACTLVLLTTGQY